MGDYTTNLNLYKTDMDSDGNDTFNFDRDLNDNWDKIDVAVDAKAPKASPALTGTPTAPTATSGDNSTKIATTAFVKDAVDNGIAGMDRTEIEVAHKISNRIYAGVDLSVKFATEIANFANVWEWIKDKIDNANYDGIHVGDYIPFDLSAGSAGGATITAQTMHAQIAGIDTYLGWGDTPIGHHIDFISKNVIDTPCQWQPNDNNNGTSAQNNPFLSSKIYAWLNGVNNYNTSAYGGVAHGLNANNAGIYQLLPSSLRNVIIQKRVLTESRYQSNTLLGYDTTWTWQNFGYLWLPNENEVYGCQVWSKAFNGIYPASHSTHGAVQYPLFAQTGGTVHNRIKTLSDGTTRSLWWLSTVHGGGTTGACNVSSGGAATGGVCSNSSIYAPVCFRVG